MVVFCPVRSQESAGDAGDLFAVLDGLPDPRRTRWRRHRLGYVLAVTFSAFTLPGFACLAGVAQWAADQSREQLLALGAWPDPFDGRVWPPGEATIRRILTRIDPAALTTACVAWTLARLRERDDAGSEAAEGEARVRAEQEGTRMAKQLKASAMPRQVRAWCAAR